MIKFTRAYLKNMRSIIVSVCILVFCFLNVSAQENERIIPVDKVPVAVVKAFKAKFPSVQSESWTLPTYDLYKAIFNVGDKTYRATFKKTGEYMGYEIIVKSKEELNEQLKILTH